MRTNEKIRPNAVISLVIALSALSLSLTSAKALDDGVTGGTTNQSVPYQYSFALVPDHNGIVSAIFPAPPNGTRLVLTNFYGVANCYGIYFVVVNDATSFKFPVTSGGYLIGGGQQTAVNTPITAYFEAGQAPKVITSSQTGLNSGCLGNPTVLVALVGRLVPAK